MEELQESVPPAYTPAPPLPRPRPAGKLFPGPHLYAGALITVLWGLSAALVPAMQRGNDNARTAHIALNCVNLLLFASQVSGRAGWRGAGGWGPGLWRGVRALEASKQTGV